jgi:hypothetical protein
MSEENRRKYIELLREARSELLATTTDPFTTDIRVKMIDLALNRLVQARSLLLRFG